MVAGLCHFVFTSLRKDEKQKQDKKKKNDMTQISHHSLQNNLQ